MSSAAADGTGLRRQLVPYQAPEPATSLSQLASSFGGFAATCAAMYALAEVSFALALLLAPLAAGFLVRIFIIQHDCGHAAFFRSRRANDLVGCICSLFTLTPYPSWRRQHAGHHRVWNDLDRRESGADFYSSCLTVSEYRALRPASRRWYRMTRHPLVANVLLPPLVFILLYRLPFDMPRSWRRERWGVHLTTLAAGVLFAGLGLILGFGRVAEVQLPVMALAAIAGVALFAVQHRGEWAMWTRHDEWDATTASLQGATCLRLPRLLQWFTGNIGFHHIHHLSPRVPNYRLQECHVRIAAFRRVPVLTLRQAFAALRLVLWDEAAGRLVTFREAGRA